jgi:hypothetical protein
MSRGPGRVHRCSACVRGGGGEAGGSCGGIGKGPPADWDSPALPEVSLKKQRHDPADQHAPTHGG